MSRLEGVGALPEPIRKIALDTDAAGGAVLVFDPEDHIIFANVEQRRIMPCCEYERKDTYSSLFYALLSRKLNGNPAANASPEAWLSDAIAARRCSSNLDFVNCYSWGKMLVSHMRLSDGTSIQARLDMRLTGMERYFEGPDACLGVARVLRMRRDILSLENALDSLGLAVALVESNGHLLHGNASFLEMIGLNDGLINKFGNGLAATDPCDNMVLQQAIKHVSAGLISTSYVPLHRKRGDPLILAISMTFNTGVLVFAVSRFNEDTSEINAALRQALGVSQAEAEVMTALASGDTVPSLSQKRGVSANTTYYQIKSAKRRLGNARFSSTDMNGICSLVSGISAISRVNSKRKH